MSNLSNLYISASYKGIINLTDSTQPFASQSSGELQDGEGNNIGISIDSSSHDVTLSSSLFVSNEISASTVNGIGNVEEFSQSVDYRLDRLEIDTGSQDARLDLLEIASQSLQNYTSSLKTAFTASGTDVTFSNNVNIPGTLRVYKIHTTIESSSVILSSGSNQLGDEPSDTQVFSGSVYVPNLHYLAGDSTDTNLRINQKLNTGSYNTDSASFDTRIDSKLGISEFNTYTQSQEDIYNTKLDASWTSSVFTPFSTSIDARMDAQEEFSSSLFLGYTTLTEFRNYTSSNDTLVNGKLNTSSYDTDSASFDTRITDLENFSSSLDDNFVSETEFTAFSSSNDTTITNLSSSIETTDTHQTSRIDDLASYTGSYATTGSNTFIGSQVISGSVQGEVTTITPVSNTASIDCSQGNFFNLSVNNTYLTATNIQPGQTIVLKLNNNISSDLTVDSGSILFPAGFDYESTPFNSTDVITFVTFDSNKLYGVAANNFQ